MKLPKTIVVVAYPNSNEPSAIWHLPECVDRDALAYGFKEVARYVLAQKAKKSAKKRAKKAGAR